MNASSDLQATLDPSRKSWVEVGERFYVRLLDPESAVRDFQRRS